MKKIFLLLAITFSLNTFGQNEKFSKIDSLLRYLASNNKFMGSVAIQENNQVIFEKAYGFADLDKNIKATPRSRYKIGSITKTFTAVVVMQLIEEKKLSLDTKLSHFYPEVPNAGKITISHLLHHSSGIYNYTNDTLFRSYMTQPHTKSELLKKITVSKSQFEPGSQYDYSNSNYIVLGYIIEDITKTTYQKNVEDRIIKKIGLKNTLFSSKINSSKDEAYSYEWNSKKWVSPKEWDMSVAFSAGSLVSTPSDLTKFMNALFEGKLLKQPSLDEMIAIEKGYGKGILAIPFGERRFYGHNGGIESFTSTVGYYPKEKLGIALIQNGQNMDMNQVIIGILSIYYKMPYRFPNVKSVDVPVATLKSYEGTYSAKDFPLKISIKEEKGILICQATGQESFPLNALSPTHFNFDPAGLELVFAKNTMTILQNGMEFKLTKE